MSANLQAEPTFKTSELAEVLYFNSGDHSLFGWLHRPVAESPAKLGLVICKPFGHEAVYAHASIRAFAEAAAAIGIPALRFDYMGTGDSEDIGADADQIAVWAQDIIAAIEELQRRSGVERVCLLGIRLGGLLAIQAASRCKAVQAVIAISPVISGRRYVRELRTTSLASILGAEDIKSTSIAPVNTESARGGAIEAAGFSLSAASVAALAQTDLTTTHAPPVPQMLIIDGVSLPTTRKWAKTLCDSDARTTYLALPGLIEMVMTPPHLGNVPEEMLGAVRDWLGGQLASLPELPEREVSMKRTAAANSVLSLPDSALSLRTLIEKPVFFGSEVVLFGIVTEPSQGEKRRRAVILLNAGGSYHVGASGINVSLARRWARRGYVVLRMDFAGLGDSSVRPGLPKNDIFPLAAVADMRAAIEFMQTSYAANDVSLVGLCSGAYHALRGAVAGLPVTRILMINPLYYFHDDTSLEDVQQAEVVRDSSAYRNRIFSLNTWTRLLTGRVDILFILKSYRHRLIAAFKSAMRDLARRLRIRLPRDLGWELEDVAARGIGVAFVFARGEPGINLLHLQAGPPGGPLGERYRVHIIDGGDHVFSKSGSREQLAQILSDELFSRRGSSGARRT